MLAVIPLPQWLLWGRPEWIALVLIYWTIALPYRVGIFTALLLGIVVDVLEGAILGQNAMAPASGEARNPRITDVGPDSGSGASACCISGPGARSRFCTSGAAEAGARSIEIASSGAPGGGLSG